MEIYTKLYATSTNTSGGAMIIPALPACTKASIDITLYNTIYNIPASTTFEFKGSGSYVAYTISPGQYSISSICATMKTIMAVTVADIDLYSDPLTKKLIMASPTIPAAGLRFTTSSVYLRSLLGVDATAYTGSLVTGPYVMMLLPGNGLYAEISGIPYSNPPVMTTSTRGQVFIPWAEFGGMMINDDRDTPRVIAIQPFLSISVLNVTFYDVYGAPVSLNGSNFTLCLNLLNSV